MKKIVVPVDFSPNAQNALLYALAFSNNYAEELETINVISPQYQPLESGMAVPENTQSWFNRTKERSQEFLEKSLLEAQSSHKLSALPSLESRIEIGLPVSTILEISEKEKVDLIILGTQGEHSAIDKFLGTVSKGIVNKAGVPVLIIPEGTKFKTISAITIAVDLLESDPWEIYKAIQTIGDSVRNVDVLHVSPPGSLRKTEITMEDLEDYFNKNDPSVKMNYFNKSSGNLNAQLNNHVLERNSDLLVMLGPHLSSFKNAFFQSNSTRMTYETKIPFLKMV